MKFYDRERLRLVGERDKLFNDPGSGLFFGKPREFVLSDPSLNLWEGIREDAATYFENRQIPWWKGAGRDPTGHLLSSQVACVNHLYLLRQRHDLATAVLRAVDPEIVEAECVDDGYVEFEFIGERQYLKEKAFSRGANCTSLDAFMIGRTEVGDKRAFLIEWKYVEEYDGKDKYVPARAKVYDALILDPASPFKPIEPRDLYFEPFYQLMRQTLLGWQFSRHGDHGCVSYRHVHVVPEQNSEFHNNITAPRLMGKTVSEAFAAVLKHPDLFISLTPERFLHPLLSARDAGALTEYLRRRYWVAG